MKRRLDLHLQKFPVVPPRLKDPAGAANHVATVDVPVLDLFLHYWKDKFGEDLGMAANLNQFEYVRFISPDADFRFKSGFGAQKEAKQNISNELGRAFARWFLTEYVGMAYFADVNAVLAQQPLPELGSHQLERVEEGDLPDYVAVDVRRDLAFVEAKGRRSKIAFTKPDFQEWRDQLDRVALVDRQGVEVSVKGYVVATRIVTTDTPRVFAGLYAEDPWTRGARRYEAESDAHRGVVALHFGSVLSRLRLDLLAASLLENFRLPENVTIPAAVWAGRHPVISGRRFIGGISRAPLSGFSPPRWRGPTMPWDLDAPSTLFFGIEETVFRSVRRIITNGRASADGVEPLVVDRREASPLVVHRDGLVMGPSNYFTFEGIEEV